MTDCLAALVAEAQGVDALLAAEARLMAVAAARFKVSHSGTPFVV